MEKARKIGNARMSASVCEDPHTVDNPVLAFFLDYWQQARNGGGLPRASAFVPQQVRSHLRWVIVADALEGYADFRYRVIGSSVCEYFLADATGKTVSEAFRDHEELRQTTIWLYRRACERQYPLRLTGPAISDKSIYFPSYDAIYLAYSSDGTRADRVVNVFNFDYRSLRQCRSGDMGIITSVGA